MTKDEKFAMAGLAAAEWQQVLSETVRNDTPGAGLFTGKLVIDPAVLQPSVTFRAQGMQTILHVTHDGAFSWHPDADALIEAMVKDEWNKATMHLLKRLRRFEQIAKSVEAHF